MSPLSLLGISQFYPLFIPESIVLWVCFKATKKAYIFERCVYTHYLETSVLKAFYYFIWCLKSSEANYEGLFYIQCFLISKKHYRSRRFLH